MNSCAASRGLLCGAIHTLVSRRGPSPESLFPGHSLWAVCFSGGERRAVQLIPRGVGEVLLENGRNERQRGLWDRRRGSTASAVGQAETVSSEGPHGAGFKGAPGLELKGVRKVRRDGNKGGTLEVPEVSGELEGAQKWAPVAQPDANTHADAAASSETPQSSSRDSDTNGGSKDRTVQASVSDSGRTECIQCHRAKLPCDFQKIKSSLDKRVDTCRACLAVVKARRLGQEMGHLQLSVDEAWARAKRCTKCQETKELRDFSVSKLQKDKIDYICRSCRSVCARILQLHPPSDAPQRCLTCKLIKPVSEYNKNKRTSTGLYASCKECLKEMARKRRQQIKASGAYAHRESKFCWWCEEERPVSLFQKRSVAYDGLTSKCKVCISLDEKSRKKPGLELPRKEREIAIKDEDVGLGEGAVG